MYAQALSSTLLGIESVLVRVEVDTAGGIPGYHLVGLPDTAVSEACDRVRAALRNSGYPMPSKRITINLSPGDLRKEGPRFDLSIALGVLCADEKLPQRFLREVLVLGELALDGTLRPVRGVLSAALEARRNGLERILLPAANASEAALVDGLSVLAARDLNHARDLLRGRADSQPWESPPEPEELREVPDLSAVKGQWQARRALEVAAAGGHHLVLVGPPGAGKTLLAGCLPSILPPLNEEEALEVTRIYSVSSAGGGPGLVRERPFRAPSAGVTPAGLLGSLTPGEVTLAHLGVLFLDEFPELRRDCLEGLRTPLECGHVAVARANFRARYPARFTLVAAMNPCPCGFFGDDQRECLCPPPRRLRYQGRFSGPLRDRIDLQLRVNRLTPAELLKTSEGEGSRSVRPRVLEARERQRARGGLNAHLPAARLRDVCPLDPAGLDFLEAAATRYGLSGRSYDRLVRIARTVADLRGAAAIELGDLAEALEYRWMDREP